MRVPRWTPCLAAALALALAVVPAHAQRAGVARVTPFVGYVASGAALDGPLGTRLTNRGTAVYGASIGVDVLPGVALVASVGYASSALRVTAPLVGGLDLADNRILLTDVGVQLRPSGATAVAPYLEAGVGAVRWDVRRGLLATQATNAAGTVGAGVDLRVGSRLAARAALKDYIGRADLREATGLDARARLAHTVTATVGLTLGL